MLSPVCLEEPLKGVSNSIEDFWSGAKAKQEGRIDVELFPPPHA